MIAGDVAPGFEAVRDAFDRCFDELGETGAAFAALVAAAWSRTCGAARVRARLARPRLLGHQADGRVLRARARRPRRDRPRRPVARYWPEFGQAGKERRPSDSCSATRPGSSPCANRGRGASYSTGTGCARCSRPRRRGGSRARARRARPLLRPPVRRARPARRRPLARRVLARGGRPALGARLPRRARRRTSSPAPSTSRARCRRSRGALPTALTNPPGALELASSTARPGARPRSRPSTATGRLMRRSVLRRPPGRRQARRRTAGRRRDRRRDDRWRDERARPGIDDEVTWGLGVWVDHDGYGMGGVGGSLAMADPDLGLAEAYVTRRWATMIARRRSTPPCAPCSPDAATGDQGSGRR